MRICPRCHARYGEDSRFCPRDGAPLPEAADSRIGTVLLGQFALEAVCGKGAMGTVYRARQASMDRLVAVKVLRQELLRDPAVVKRFQREARAIAKIQHPNIVTVFLVGETDDGVPFLVMEYVEGEALADVLDRERAIPAVRALRIARQVSSALAEAHAAGIVHRDLKPANLVLSQKRRAPDFTYVLDFGIAKILHGTAAAQGESHLSRTGTIFGTPHYIAPEQAGGFEVDHRADLYSLGVILYRMVTGRLPFEGSGVAVLLAHMQRPVPLPREVRPDVEPQVEALIMRALAKDPRERFQSAEELGDAIDAIRATSGSLSASSAIAASPTAPSPNVPIGARTVAGVGRPGQAAVAQPPPASPAPPKVSTPQAGVTPWTIRGVAPVSGDAAHALVPSMPVAPVAPLAAAPDSTPVPYGVDDDAPAEPAPPPPSGPAHPRSAGVREAATLPAQPTPSTPVPAAMPPRAAIAVGVSEVAPRDASDDERFSGDGASASFDELRPPRGRLLLLAIAALLAGTGLVATIVWFARGREAATQLTSPQARPSASGAASTPGAASTSGAASTPGAAATSGSASTTGAGPAPIAGSQGAPAAEGGSSARATTPAVPEPSAEPKRRLTLGEGGYAARVFVPAHLAIGEDAEIVVEAFDRKGAPLASQELFVSIEDPSGVELVIGLPRAGAPGRFVAHRTFAAGGRHHVHIYPVGKGGLHMYFDLVVEGPAPKRPARLNHHDRPSAGHRPTEEKVLPRPPEGSAPPSAPPKSGPAPASSTPPAVNGDFAQPPPATPPPPPPPAPPKRNPDDDSNMLE